MMVTDPKYPGMPAVEVKAAVTVKAERSYAGFSLIPVSHLLP